MKLGQGSSPPKCRIEAIGLTDGQWSALVAFLSAHPIPAEIEGVDVLRVDVLKPSLVETVELRVEGVEDLRAAASAADAAAAALEWLKSNVPIINITNNFAPGITPEQARSIVAASFEEARRTIGGGGAG